MATTKVNPTQQHLMKLFAFNRSKKSLSELKDVLFNYYASKTEQLVDTFWQESQMTETELSETSSKHLRTRYE